MCRGGAFRGKHQALRAGLGAHQIDKIAEMVGVRRFDPAALDPQCPIPNALQRIVQGDKSHFLKRIIDGRVIVVAGLVLDGPQHLEIEPIVFFDLQSDPRRVCKDGIQKLVQTLFKDRSDATPLQSLL